MQTRRARDKASGENVFVTMISVLAMLACVYMALGPTSAAGRLCYMPWVHFCSGQAIYTTKRDMGCECFSRFGV